MTTAPEMKVRRPTWDEAEHPRDRLGRFIEKFSIVRIGISGTGKVLRNLGGGWLEVERSIRVEGEPGQAAQYAPRTARVHRSRLTVIERPADQGGGPPTAQPTDVADSTLPVDTSAPPPPEAPEPEAPSDEGRTAEAPRALSPCTLKVKGR